LRDIERLAVQAGTELSADVQKALGVEGSQGHSRQTQMCEQCGALMQRRGQHSRQVITEAGSSPLERAYFVCPSCGHSFFPLDEAWELDGSVYGAELKRNMVWLCGLLSFAQAAEVMRRIGKRQVSDSSLWRMVQQAGQRLLQQAALEQSKDGVAHTDSTSAESSTKLLSMDGGMVNIWGEGWKEFKVALVGPVVADEPPESNIVPEVHTQVRRYAAVLGDVPAFTPTLLDLGTVNK
jgi:hypothetical protein